MLRMKTTMKYMFFLIGLIISQVSFSQQLESDKDSNNMVNPYAEKPLIVNQFIYFDTEVIQIDFESFQPFFHKRNIKILEKSKILWGLEYGVQYKKLFFGTNINFSAQKGSVTDSVDSKVNYNRFGLSIGYYILNSKHFQILPRSSIYYHSLSLKNFNNQKYIDLQDYTSHPDFKVKFSQYTAQFGLDINIKIPSISTKPGQPFLLGFKTAYNINLGHTRLTSEENTLKSNANFEMSNVTFGMHFTILL